jgi:hypothetical protein
VPTKLEPREHVHKTSTTFDQAQSFQYASPKGTAFKGHLNLDEQYGSERSRGQPQGMVAKRFKGGPSDPADSRDSYHHGLSKKERNKIAAEKYRNKKKAESDNFAATLQALKTENDSLRQRVRDLEAQLTAAGVAHTSNTTLHTAISIATTMGQAQASPSGEEGHMSSHEEGSADSSSEEENDEEGLRNHDGGEGSVGTHQAASEDVQMVQTPADE